MAAGNSTGATPGVKCRKEISILSKSLHMSQNEKDWMLCLMSLEETSGASDLEVLSLLKTILLGTESVQALKNVAQLFLRKTSTVIEEKQILKNEKLARQVLTTVKDFWSILSNEHVFLTQQIFGRFSPELYEVLPSLASVLVDLFIAAHRDQDKAVKQSKKLHSWLLFELNERCLKTALLEVMECTNEGAQIVLPLLRKLLSRAPKRNTHMDYLLHIILLKRWSFVCTELNDILQSSSDIKAPKNFVNWLSHHWPRANYHFPADKSLKGRRVSELLLDLDQGTVEELIDIFSQCLWSLESDAGDSTLPSAEGSGDGRQEIQRDLFVIDKKGAEADMTTPPRKKPKKMNQNKVDREFVAEHMEIGAEAPDVGDTSDIFMIPGLLNDTVVDSSSKSQKKVKQQGGETTNKKGKRKAAQEASQDEEEMELGFEEEGERKKYDDSGEDNCADEAPRNEENEDESSAVSVSSKSKSISETANGLSSPNVLGFVVDRTSKHLSTNKISSPAPLNSGKDPAISYFIDKSTKPVKTFQLHSRNSSGDDVEIIDGMEIQIFRASDDISKAMGDSTDKIEESPARELRKRQDSRSSNDVDNNKVDASQLESSIQSQGARKFGLNVANSSQEIEISSDEDVDVTYLSDSSTSSSIVVTGTSLKKKMANTTLPITKSERTLVDNPPADMQRQTRLRRSSESSIHVSPVGENASKNKTVKQSDDENVIEEQIGKQLSEIRKMMDYEKDLPPRKRNSERISHTKTRLRSQSESTVDSSNIEKEKDHRQAVTSVRSKPESGGTSVLKDWLRTPPTGKEKLSALSRISTGNEKELVKNPKPKSENNSGLPRTRKISETGKTVPKSDSGQQSLGRKLKSPSSSLTGNTASSSSGEGKKETPKSPETPVSSKTIKPASSSGKGKSADSTRAKKQKEATPDPSDVDVDVEVNESESNTSVTSLTRSSEKLTPESKQRYFLRTNCGHRSLDSDMVCPTCTPKKIASSLEKDGPHEASTKKSTRSKTRKSVQSSSPEDSPKKLARSKSRSLRSSSKTRILE